jgi:hypothetical protein
VRLDPVRIVAWGVIVVASIFVMLMILSVIATFTARGGGF